MNDNKTKITVHSYNGGYKHFTIMRKLRNIEKEAGAGLTKAGHSHTAVITFRGAEYNTYLQRYPDGTSGWNIQI